MRTWGVLLPKSRLWDRFCPNAGLPHLGESHIDPWPRYFWKISRYTSHFHGDIFAKICPPLQVGRKEYMHHQFVSRYASHLYRDAFAEVLGSGVVGTLSIKVLLKRGKVRMKSIEIMCFQIYTAYPDRAEKTKCCWNPARSVWPHVRTTPFAQCRSLHRRLHQINFMNLTSVIPKKITRCCPVPPKKAYTVYYSKNSQGINWRNEFHLSYTRQF